MKKEVETIPTHEQVELKIKIDELEKQKSVHVKQMNHVTGSGKLPKKNPFQRKSNLDIRRNKIILKKEKEIEELWAKW